ncbi:MAG: hypothetical protein CL578_00425 [Alteromonadaceae bacterium]|uniref:hypothetical protein n=1 Tax=Paraglaciecola chathamensis TaxID=368405 RepID=UPI000C395CB1|nr:hypothetical protein [Paraglaciecola agarilytica]MBN23502.1 hypothetical protein [Alteromonadaceae bacterium]|tara:strand:+ start:26802 stop:27329 length:528 start_codon:yes stop_codon:yes gene_type:complete
MIRLTSRAWNNVLIISMLLLILMFNLSGNLFSDEGATDEAIDVLIPHDGMLTSIVTHAYTIERVGRGWRFVPPSNDLVSEESEVTRENLTVIDNQTLTDLVIAWQSAELAPIGNATLTGATQVNLWLAGESAPRHYLFFQVGEDMLVQYPTQGAQLYKITNMTWSQLFLTDTPNA